ncbi:hypothetical protein CQA49_07960 [Helicobacter sp. MIT 00-7814]|uniref:hypothetical protein n=1 Tax=unclassified Helicobacter TaxID=2593540 RepID=UPI000E1EF5B2|nr:MULTISPECIES: hypothetical protein [unclassified Helicobacter]RDU52623.1 hypothetical protein CQA49_07960 [Helicobacter sp. MIT 00-7814]RDU55920.1 hypothetical protein CQA37_03230 [Helicobacter sp. MIT 99-10781]
MRIYDNAKNTATSSTAPTKALFCLVAFLLVCSFVTATPNEVDEETEEHYPRIYASKDSKTLAIITRGRVFMASLSYAIRFPLLDHARSKES